MSAFDKIRDRNKQGQEAKERVMQRFSSSSTNNGSSMFDSIRNRKIDIEPVKTETFGTPMKDLQQNFGAITPTNMINSYMTDTQRQQQVKSQPKPLTQYDVNLKDINEGNYPAPVKSFARTMNWLTEGNPVGKFFSRAGYQADYILSGGNPVTIQPDTGSKVANSISDFGGSVMSVFAPTGAPINSGPIAGTYNVADNLLTSQAGQKAEQALVNQVSKVVKPQTAQAITREGLREAAAGSMQGAAYGLMTNQDGEGVLKEALLGGGIGGTLGVGLKSAGIGISKLMKNNGIPESEIAEILALPEGKLDSRLSTASERSVLKAGTDPIINPYTFELPEASLESLSDFKRTNSAKNKIKSIDQELSIEKIRHEQKVIDEYKRLKNTDSGLTNRQLYEQARASVDVENTGPVRTTNSPLVEQRLKITNPTGKQSNVSAPEPIVQQVPKSPGTVERGFASTLKESKKTPAEFTERLNSNHTPITNPDTVQKANLRISNSVDEATNYVLGPSKFDADKSVTAQRLIDHYNQQKNYQMAVSIADKVASEATTAGQAIQALSIYDKLTPEGILIHAKQIVNKVNENLPKYTKESVITDQMAADLTDLASTTQKMTGVKNLSNDVMDILQRAKSGEKLTSAETEQLQRFVNESKQFIKESTKPQKPPKAPTQPKDKRVRQAVTTFLDAQEEAAKERLRARGIRISSTPLDVWADYAIIGAAKMGKGIVKFSEWSEVMIKELGEEIRPMLNQLYERARETFETSTKTVSKQTVSNAERLTEKIIKTKELTPDEADQLMGLAQRVSNLSGEEKRLASQDLQAILQELNRPTVLKKISAAQTTAQLLNPKTHVRNVVGNEMFYRVERLNKILSTPIDIARSKLTGGQRYVTFKTNNQGQFWKNWMEGTKAGWRGVNINGLQTQFDLAGQAFRGKYNPMTYLEKTLGAALRGFDNAAYMRAYNNTLGELGTLDAINKGIKPSREYVQQFIAKADDNIMQIADSYGRYVTFQDNNIISKGMSGLKRGLNFGKDFGMGDLVLKYPKTPGALLMRALEYSPAGFLRSGMIIAKPILKKSVESAPAEAVQALSRAIIGTLGFSGMGYFLLDKGILTGDASRDKDIRSLEQAAGRGAYQVNLSALQRFVKSGFDTNEATIQEDDFLYTYDWAQPLSMAISMGANMRKSQDGEKETAVGVGMNVLNNVASGVNTLTGQSVLQGIARAAEGYPGQTVSDKIRDILSEVPSSFTPTMLNQIKQLTDNTRRETYSPDKWEQSLNKAQARIPGLAQRLPAQYDTLGNEKQTYQDNNLFNVLLNPGFSSRYKLSPEAKLIVDLITETGDESLAPRVPGKTVDGNKLTGEQFSRYSQLQGEETRKRLEKINPNAKTSTQVKKVQKALTKSSEQSKKKLKKEFGLQKVDKK